MTTKCLKRCPVALVALVLAASVTSMSYARDSDGTWRVLGTGSERPDKRKHHTMIYDPEANRVVLYGGETHSGGQDVALGDVWVLDVACPRWQRLYPAGSPAPVARHGHQAIYVGDPPRMIIFGGRSGFEAPPETSFVNDAWTLTLTGTPTWTRLLLGPPLGNFSCANKPFLPRTHASASLLAGQFVLFGGRVAYGGASPIQDAWGINVSTGAWTLLSGSTFPTNPCNALPEHRYWHSSIVDNFGRMVIFGGLYDSDVNSTAWATSNGINWTKVGVAPPAMIRMFHAAVFDPEADRMIVHGGYHTPDKEIISNTAFALEGLSQLPPSQNADWVELNADPGTGDPGYIAEHAAVYVPAPRDWMIVFGGVGQSNTLRPNTVHVLEFDDDIVPPATATLVGGTGRTTSVLSWTAPGDDGACGTADHYELRRASFVITPANFATATLVTTSSPLLAGTPQCVEMQGLTHCQTYWYALKTWDDSGNVSGMSTISMTQTCNYLEVYCDELLAAGVPRAPVTLEYRIAGANPSTGHTLLAFGIPAQLAGKALDITVYDVAGRRVRTLEQRLAVVGQFTTSWDHRGADGREVAVGMYFAKLQIGSETHTQKILVAPGR